MDACRQQVVTQHSAVPFLDLCVNVPRAVVHECNEQGCGRSFDSQQALWAHMATHKDSGPGVGRRRRQPKVLCPKCKWDLVAKSQLQAHQRTCKGPPKFVCRICKRINNIREPKAKKKTDRFDTIVSYNAHCCSQHHTAIR